MRLRVTGDWGENASIGSMEDFELFPRQAVIVKNGKIFVEDEPFFCADEDKGTATRHSDQPDGDVNKPQVDNRNDSGEEFDDVESEKENRVCHDIVSRGSHPYDHDLGIEDNDCNDEDNEDDDGGGGGDDEERFFSFVDREEFFEDVDGLRLQGLPDGPIDPADFLDCIQ